MSNKNSTPSMIICTVCFFSTREGLTLKAKKSSHYPPEDSQSVISWKTEWSWQGAEFQMRFIILACRSEVIVSGICKKVEMRKWIRGKHGLVAVYWEEITVFIYIFLGARAKVSVLEKLWGMISNRYGGCGKCFSILSFTFKDGQNSRVLMGLSEIRIFIILCFWTPALCRALML